MKEKSALNVVVLGTAQPQGSKRYVGKGQIVEDNKRLQPWRDLVTYRMFEAKPRDWPSGLAYSAYISFVFTRPKGHYGTGVNIQQLRKSAPMHKTTAPDVDKLIRAILDSCTDAKVWDDDSRVVSVCGTKTYGDIASTTIKIKAWA